MVASWAPSSGYDGSGYTATPRIQKLREKPHDKSAAERCEWGQRCLWDEQTHAPATVARLAFGLLRAVLVPPDGTLEAGVLLQLVLIVAVGAELAGHQAGDVGVAA